MHRHPLGIVLMVIAAVIVGNFAVDVLAGGFPGNVPLRGLKQSVTGA